MIGRLRKLWTRIRGTVRHEQHDLELQDEIEEHVRLLTERYRRQGMTADVAMRARRASCRLNLTAKRHQTISPAMDRSATLSRLSSRSRYLR
jgi:hypothetical protein